MSVLTGIVEFLGVVFLLTAGVGLISPSVLRDRKTGEVPKRLEIFLGGIGVAAIAFVIAGFTSPDPEGAAVDGSSKKAEITAPDKSLGMTPEKFRQTFNQQISQIDDSYATAEFKIENGAVHDTFTRSFGKNLAMIGTVSKQSGQMRDLMIVVGGRSEDVVKPMAVLLVAATLVNTEPLKKQVSSSVIEMVRLAVADIETGAPHERTIGDIHYIAAASEMTGLMFSISPREAASD